jgi:hypothetical protein
MSASMTFQNSNAFDAAGARLFNAVARSVSHLMQVLSAPQPSAPRTVAQLLALAESYEATQPSFAADLRAAAER